GRDDRPRDEPRRTHGRLDGRRRGRDARPGRTRGRRGPRRSAGLMYGYITFLTDFGLQDDFVGVCRGVIKRIARDVQIIDITHGIAPQAITQGALVLARAVPYMPPGINLAIVDPGVGRGRRAVAIRTRDERVYIGPDNGLLMLAADAGPVEAGRELTDPRYRLEPV